MLLKSAGKLDAPARSITENSWICQTFAPYQAKTEDISVHLRKTMEEDAYNFLPSDLYCGTTGIPIDCGPAGRNATARRIVLRAPADSIG